MNCAVCGDHFEPKHRHAQDCPDCRAWASRPMFGLPAERTIWKQAKRFGAVSLSKRLALREPAFGVRVPDPSATQRVPVFVARETVAVPSLQTSSQAS